MKALLGGVTAPEVLETSSPSEARTRNPRPNQRWHGQRTASESELQSQLGTAACATHEQAVRCS